MRSARPPCKVRDQRFPASEVICFVSGSIWRLNMRAFGVNQNCKDVPHDEKTNFPFLYVLIGSSKHGVVLEQEKDALSCPPQKCHAYIGTLIGKSTLYQYFFMIFLLISV